MRTSCIRLRANSRIAVLYEDLLEICDGNMLAAMLLSSLVYWTDVKTGQKDENLWIWKSHEGFQEDLMFDKPGMKPPHRTTISSALNLLKDKSFIEWRKNPKVALDRTRQYLVHQNTIQEAIDKLPALESRKSNIAMSENRLSTDTANEAGSDDSMSDHPNVGKPTMQSRNNDNALSEKQHCNVGKPTSNTSDYDSVITKPVITREGTLPREQSDDSGSVEPTHALSSSQDNQPTRQDHANVEQRINDALPVIEQELRRKSGALSQDSDGYQKGHANDNDTHSRLDKHHRSGGIRTLSAQNAQDEQGTKQSTGSVQQPVGSVAQPGRTGRSRSKKTAEPEVEFTPEGRKVYDAWASLFKSPPPAGPQTIKCANALYPLLVPWCKDLRRTCAQLLDDIQKQMYATDKNKFYARGITLCDVHRDFEKWQSAMTQGAISSKPKSEDDPYSLEALFARQGQTLA